MNTSLLCCCVALAATPAVADDVDALFAPPPGVVEVVRAQSPVPTYDDPAYGGPSMQPSYPAPQPSGPFDFSSPPMGDPFLGGGQPVPGAIVGPTAGTDFPFGLFRLAPPQPGWDVSTTVATLPNEGVNVPGAGEFGVFEWDNELRYTWPHGYGWLLSVAQEYDLRSFAGPQGPIELSNNVHRLGWDLELRSPPQAGPWGAVLGFNPSLNTDFERSPGPRAWNWDGRGYLTYAHSPHLTLIGGAGFWDRVNDRVIPYAGAIWKPSSRWELHLTVPEAKIAYFLGNAMGHSHWIYARAEYHVEAYEVETGFDPNRARDKFEVEDYRIVGGWALSNGWIDGFVEVGAVVDRHADYQFNTQPDFGIDDGFFGRMGVQF